MKEEKNATKEAFDAAAFARFFLGPSRREGGGALSYTTSATTTLILSVPPPCSAAISPVHYIVCCINDECGDDRGSHLCLPPRRTWIPFLHLLTKRADGLICLLDAAHEHTGEPCAVRFFCPGVTADYILHDRVG